MYTLTILNMEHSPASTDKPLGSSQRDPSSGQTPKKTKSEASNEMSKTEPTRPPRVSFGVELEFLLARKSSANGDPDKAIRERLGTAVELESDEPDATLDAVGEETPIKAVIALLTLHGIPVKEEEKSSAPRDISKPQTEWVVKTDISCTEVGGVDYDWVGMEVVSPPSYACDEAFELVELVVRLLTTNFRTRVNGNCGLHVHVGNGPHYPDMRALRNYASLIWGAEPLLSKLQDPERVVIHWAPSLRMTNTASLPSGATAEMARNYLSKGHKWVPYYRGRARKLGEAPVASIAVMKERIDAIREDDDFCDPDWESDDSDWEAGEPFFRPKRTVKKGMESEDALGRNFLRYTAETVRVLDAASLADGPPETEHIAEPLAESMDESMGESTTDESTGSSEYWSSDPAVVDRYLQKRVTDAASLERRPWRPFMAREVPREAQKNVEPLLRTRGCQVGPATTDGWSGGQELLSCDINVSQLAYLLVVKFKGTAMISKNMSYNWTWLMVNPDHWTGRTLETIECRMGAGSLDPKWIVTWIKIQCRMLEWARDVEPSKFMRVLGLLYDQDDRETPTYDILDLLEDMGLHTEIKLCQERLKRKAEAWNECIVLKGASKDPDPGAPLFSPPSWAPVINDGPTLYSSFFQ